ncbi:MAG: tripartite tricarboxylate transporter substrate binding protein [Burkholderiales bacterium]|nr:tripartite tricarboxylate transporter substrate binding protein [Burkholderiales bacterium]
MKTLRFAVVLALCAGMPAPAADWSPTERITLVTHSSPGTGNELLLREIADIWNKGKLVPRLASVESVTGSQGEKARRYVITENRGNTHMLAAFTPPSLNVPILLGSDTGWRQFTPIAMMVIDPMVLVVNAQGPYQSLRELIAATKQKPRQVMQGGGSYGNSSSMAGKLLEEAAGVSFSYVPFKGGGTAVLNLLGNHVHFIIENPAEIQQHVEAGKLRVIAVSQPLEQFRGAPTFEQAGVRMKQLKQFRALMAPPGIGTEVAQGYIRLLERTRATPQWKDYLKRTALVENWMVGSELAGFLAEEEKVYARLDDEMGLRKARR